MVFTPPRMAPLLVGLGAILAALAVAVLVVVVLLDVPISLSSFFLGLGALLLLVLTALTAWRTYCCWRLRYRLTRNALTIFWGTRREVVPLGNIRKLVEGRDRAIRWAGGVHGFAYHVGQGQVEGLGAARFYSTHLSPLHLIYVVTDDLSYGLSLQDPRRFARSLEMCRGLGPLERTESRVEEGWLASLPLWRDPWVLALFLGALAVNLSLFAYLTHRYPSLSAFLPLHFAASGQVDRIGMKLEVFKLPGMALAVLGANGVVSLVLHLKERYLGLLALAVALLVQALFGVAVLRITG